MPVGKVIRIEWIAGNGTVVKSGDNYYYFIDEKVVDIERNEYDLYTESEHFKHVKTLYISRSGLTATMLVFFPDPEARIIPSFREDVRSMWSRMDVLPGEEIIALVSRSPSVTVYEKKNIKTTFRYIDIDTELREGLRVKGFRFFQSIALMRNCYAVEYLEDTWRLRDGRDFLGTVEELVEFLRDDMTFRGWRAVERAQWDTIPTDVEIEGKLYKAYKGVTRDGDLDGFFKILGREYYMKGNVIYEILYPLGGD